MRPTRTGRQVRCARGRTATSPREVRNVRNVPPVGVGCAWRSIDRRGAAAAGGAPLIEARQRLLRQVVGSLEAVRVAPRRRAQPADGIHEMDVASAEGVLGVHQDVLLRHEDPEDGVEQHRDRQSRSEDGAPPRDLRDGEGLDDFDDLRVGLGVGLGVGVGVGVGGSWGRGRARSL